MNDVNVGLFSRFFDERGRVNLAELGVEPGEKLTIEQENDNLILRSYSVYLKQYNDFIARSNAAKTSDEASMWRNAARNISMCILAILIAAEKSRVQIPTRVIKEHFPDADGITFQGIGDGFNMVPCNKQKK